jgi:hypothetical protein
MLGKGDEENPEGGEEAERVALRSPSNMKDESSAGHRYVLLVLAEH